MQRREFLLSTGVAALGLSAFPACWASAAGTKKQRVLYFTRSQGFEHSVVRGKAMNWPIRKRSSPTWGRRPASR